MKYLLTVIALALAVSTGFADTHTHSDDNNYTWIQSDDGEKLEVRIHGSVDLSDDSTAITRMAASSSLYAEQRSGGTTRSVSVKPRGGDFAYEYKVDGRVQAFATIPGATDYLMVARGVFKETTRLRQQPIEPEARAAEGGGGGDRRDVPLTDAQKARIREALNLYLKPYLRA